MINKALRVIPFILFLSMSVQAQNEEAFEQRVGDLIDHVADVYAANSPGWDNNNSSVPDPEKYAWPSVLARFDKYGIDDAMGNIRIETFRNNSPFHFPFVGMARIMSLYPEAPKMMEHKKRYLEQVWQRDDSFNAWTGEGTENHVNMNRTSGYLYAQHVLEAGYQDELFQDAGEKLQSMKEWIMYWSKQIYKSGTAEWNSSTYGVHNIVGWLNLYDFAADEEVKKAARAVLDYYASELALHYTQGITGGAEMRGGSAYRSVRTDTDYLSWLWFGDSPRQVTFEGNQPIYSMYAATSTYRPPAAAIELARKEVTSPAMYYGSKPSYLFDHTSYVKQTFYIDPNYTLGAAYLPYGGWSGGDWQIVSWKLVGRVEADESNVENHADFVSGGGMYFQDRGLHRKPFDQLVHHENVLVQLSKVPTDASDIKAVIEPMFEDWHAKWKADFTERFPTESWKVNQPHVNFQSQDVTQNSSFISIRRKDRNVEFEMENELLFVKLEKVYLAIRSIHQPQPTEPQVQGDFYKVEDTAAPGVLSGFVMEVGSVADFSSFDDFKSEITEKTSLDRSRAATENTITYQNLQEDILEITYSGEGSFTEPIFDWGFGVENPQVKLTSPPFMQPEWPSGAGHGKLARWKVNGEEVTVSEDWPVFEGPNLLLQDSKLVMRAPGERTEYTVDYSGEVPAFSEKELVTGFNREQPEKEPSIFSYPNPSGTQIKIVFHLPVSTYVTLTVFDNQGKVVKQLIREDLRETGRHKIVLPTGTLTPGQYLCHLTSSVKVASTKLIVK